MLPSDGETQDFEQMFNVNVMAACVCVREAAKDMRRRGANGHLIIINR